MRKPLAIFFAIASAAILALLGVISPSAAAGPSPAVMSSSYAYDAPYYDAPGSGSRQEHGPPNVVVTNTTYGAADGWSRGSSARFGWSAPPTTYTYTYNDRATYVHVGDAAVKTSAVTPSAPQTFVRATRSLVAANAGRDSVVIGRGMTRVREAAGVLDAGTYEASRLTKALAARGFVKPMLLENKLWLRGQMLRGRTIYDIGHGGIEMPSIFYEMERATVHGYGGYAPVPWVG